MRKYKMHLNAQMSRVQLNGRLCPGLAPSQLFVLIIQPAVSYAI